MSDTAPTTFSTVVFTSEPQSKAAGANLGKQIETNLNGQKPSVVIVFASSSYEYSKLLAEINETCKPALLVGCSSAGEFTSADYSADSASAVAIYSNEIKFAAGLGRGIKHSRMQVVETLAGALTGVNKFEYPHQSALLLADALSGHTDEIIDLLTEQTGSYQFFGGGAGDNAQFQKTHVFFGEEAYTDAAVLLEILSKKPLGVGVKHGWKPSGKKMRVTASEGMKLISLNGITALEVFQEYATATGQMLDSNEPISFFLHNILGIQTAQGFKLRVPLSIDATGAIHCASDIPEGAIISFMATDTNAAKDAAREATNMAIENLNGSKPGVALFFDCVATRLRMGSQFEEELQNVKQALGDINFAGCNTYGQIARIYGQFNGFHNCTAVVCVIPE